MQTQELPLTAEVSHSYETIVAEVTMYTSEPEQTDDTPFITANGEEVKHGTIACPQRYEFGTKVVIRNVEYKCNDRMHSKYKNNFDIWVNDKEKALSFGRQSLQVLVYD